MDEQAAARVASLSLEIVPSTIETEENFLHGFAVSFSGKGHGEKRYLWRPDLDGAANCLRILTDHLALRISTMELIQGGKNVAA